jgi:CHAD domain-containing protein
MTTQRPEVRPSDGGETVLRDFDDSKLWGGDSPVGSVGRAISEQLDRVIAVLQHPGADPTDAVHRARKALKRTRGLVRLIRDALGRGGYRSLNRRLRDTARILAPIRDAAIRLETFDTNRSRLAERVAPGILLETHECLTGEFAAAYPDGGLNEAVVAEVFAGVEEARRLLGDSGFGSGGRYSGDGDAKAGMAILMHGLLRVYQSGRSDMRAAETSGDFNDFHEWRRHVKYLRYQLEHLAPLTRNESRDAIVALKQIDGYLGDAHDLWMLGNFTEAHPSCCEDRDLREVFIGAMDGRRHVLNSRALRVGTPLFAAKPKEFVARIEEYWARPQ